MHIRQLDYFLKIAERRSISAAAAELNVTQPTLTKSVKLLERELGVPLFERLPRGVELTSYGKSLVRHARSVRVQIDDAVGELEGLRSGAQGTIAIGAGPAWLRRHLPLAVARSLAGRPQLKVRVVGGFDEALIRALRMGALDFVVAEFPSPESARDLEIEPLTSDSLAVCCRTTHPLTGRRNVGLKTLLQYPWVLPAQNPRARIRLEAHFLAQNLPPPEPAVETDSMTFLFSVLRTCDALSYTTSATTRPPGGSGLTLIDVPALRSTRNAGIMTRRGAWLSPAAQTVLCELKAICREDGQN